MKFEAQVKEQPARFVAFMRHVGPYSEIGKAWDKFMGWAGQKGLLQFPTTEMLSIYHDDPSTVDASQLRSDVCITVPAGTRVDGEVKTMTLPGGMFAVAHVEIDATEYGAAWDKLMGEWMPAHGATPDISRKCFELYLNDPNQHPEKKHIVDICEPVT
ncbi:GyrI-like domain-containing protein [Candidatus Bipolaricaulota bacterium]|nr:GyrI-like domain-containing protein [Candidatus Bipolaricaulota bacterium]